MDPVDEIFKEAEDHMKKTLQLSEDELATIRTGKASPAILDSVKVDYYGSRVPLNQVANVSVPDPKLIVIKPWEKPMVPEIAKAIQTADLGLNPQSDAGIIRIPLPSLTEERRRELAKGVNNKVEEAKIAIRNIRRNANDKLNKLEKDHQISEDDCHRFQDDIQELTDRYTEKLDQILEAKNKEIMEF